MVKYERQLLKSLLLLGMNEKKKTAQIKFLLLPDSCSKSLVKAIPEWKILFSLDFKLQ